MPVLAEKVALIHTENLGKGVKRSIDSIAVEQGLTPSYARNGQIQKTQAFQNVIAKWREKTAQRLQKKSNIALSLITKKALRQHSAKDLMSIVDTSIKNTQLLSGGATENKAVLIGALLDEIEEKDK